VSVAVSAADARAELGRALGRPGTAELERLVPLLARDHPNQPFTFFARAELARRSGDVRAALGPAATALALMLPGAAKPDGTLPLGQVIATLASLPRERLTPLMPYVDQFGAVMERAGLYRDIGERLSALAQPLLAPGMQPRLTEAHAQLVLSLLAFAVESDEAWAANVFERVVLPWMDASAAAGQFDTAFMLEAIAYNAHTKRRENQEWFKHTAGRWMGPLAGHARAARGRYVPAHERWRREARRRVGFLVHNATMLAHIQVLVETLEAVARVGPRDYEFTVFVLGGRNADMQRRLSGCGVAIRYLDEGAPAGMHARMVRLQRILRDENYLACVWTSLVTLMAPAFAFRIAPLQVWWAMKYHACELPEIDARLALENVVLKKRLEGHDWLTIGNSSAQWIVPGREADARALRGRYPADKVVAACVGREEKLDSPPFLQAVSTLLKRHPELHFIWTGRTRRESIQSHFEREGVAGRTEFAGWVDTKLYAQAVDLFLDSFPFPCGFSLKEAMAAGKPSVMFRSPESIETGVPGSLSPAKAGDDSVAPDVREALRVIFSRERDFDLYLCAETPEEYVELASRAIADAAHRARVGAANREYIERFVSSPEAEATKLLAHLDHLCAKVPTQ